jgi:nucleoid DNA-binding protein
MEIETIFARVVEDKGLAHEISVSLITDLFKAVATELENGEAVNIEDFGRFAVQDIPAADSSLPPRRIPFFKSDTELRRQVNGFDWAEPQPSSIQ